MLQTSDQIRLPSAALTGTDDMVHFGLNWWNLVKASLISPQHRCCSPSRAICSAHCCLSCPSARHWELARRLHSFTSLTRITFLRQSMMDSVVWDIHGFTACLRGPRTLCSCIQGRFINSPLVLHRLWFNRHQVSQSQVTEKQLQHSFLTAGFDRAVKSGMERVFWCGLALLTFSFSVVIIEKWSGSMLKLQ